MSVNAVGCLKWKGHISARGAKEWKKKKGIISMMVFRRLEGSWAGNEAAYSPDFSSLLLAG